MLDWIEDVPQTGRVNRWNQRYSSEVEPARFTPADARHFEPELAVAGIGDLRLIRLETQPALMTRLLRPDAPPSRHYVLLLLASGEARIDHAGQSLHLTTGDGVLCNGAGPLRLAIEAEAEFLLLRIPQPLLRDHLPTPDHYCGQLLPSDEGVTSTIAAMMASLSDRIAKGAVLPMADRVARHLLDMVATAYAMAFEPACSGSSVVSARLAAIRLFIEQNLRDPELSAREIARRLNLSPRYLRMIFALSGETVSGYVLRRRLEESARQIADPHWQGHSITEIAFGWGFNSAPHFTRSFRERFGACPRGYRRERLADRGGSAAGPAVGKSPARQRLPADARVDAEQGKRASVSSG